MLVVVCDVFVQCCKYTTYMTLSNFQILKYFMHCVTVFFYIISSNLLCTDKKPTMMAQDSIPNVGTLEDFVHLATADASLVF